MNYKEFIAQIFEGLGPSLEKLGITSFPQLLNQDPDVLRVQLLSLSVPFGHIKKLCVEIEKERIRTSSSQKISFEFKPVNDPARFLFLKNHFQAALVTPNPLSNSEKPWFHVFGFSIRTIYEIVTPTVFDELCIPIYHIAETADLSHQKPIDLQKNSYNLLERGTPNIQILENYDYLICQHFLNSKAQQFEPRYLIHVVGIGRSCPSLLPEGLSQGWNVLYDCILQRPIFANTETKETTWLDPRLSRQIENQLNLEPLTSEKVTVASPPWTVWYDSNPYIVFQIKNADSCKDFKWTGRGLVASGKQRMNLFEIRYLNNSGLCCLMLVDPTSGRQSSVQQQAQNVAQFRNHFPTGTQLEFLSQRSSSVKPEDWTFVTPLGLLVDGHLISSNRVNKEPNQWDHSWGNQTFTNHSLRFSVMLLDFDASDQNRWNICVGVCESQIEGAFLVSKSWSGGINAWGISLGTSNLISTFNSIKNIQRSPKPRKISIGDIITVIFDRDTHTLSFLWNGQALPMTWTLPEVSWRPLISMTGNHSIAFF